MNIELIQKTEAFLKETFENSSFLKANPFEKAYRLEHSYRVANIGRQIAETEGFDPTAMVIACLLHDIAYCREMSTPEERRAHGRTSAQIARPFLSELPLPLETVNDILYGIAIHVDDAADFKWRRTPFAETISDADNIDRFDTYRIYENLEYHKFSKLTLDAKQQRAASMLDQLSKLRSMKLGTQTATHLWQQKIDYYISFYEKLKLQLDHSAAIL